MNRPFDWLGAYKDGYRAGTSDRQLGRCLRSAFISFSSDPPYTQEYSRGYRRGVLGLPAQHIMVQ